MLWPARTGNRPRRQASPKSLHGSYVAAARGRPCGTTSRDDASGALNAVRSQVGAPLAGRTLLRMGDTAMSGADDRGDREARAAPGADGSRSRHGLPMRAQCAGVHLTWTTRLTPPGTPKQGVCDLRRDPSVIKRNRVMVPPDSREASLRVTTRGLAVSPPNARRLIKSAPATGDP